MFREQASALPDIVTAAATPALADDTETNWPAQGKPIVHGRAIPNPAWLHDFLTSFHSLRQQISSLSWARTVERASLPPLSSKDEWRSICLGPCSHGAHVTIHGSALVAGQEGQGSDRQEGSSPSPASCPDRETGASNHMGHVKNYPGISADTEMDVLLEFSQVHTARLLEHFVSWMEEEGEDALGPAAAKWLFALCACLDPPLLGETCAALRDLLRQCSRAAERCSPAHPDQAASDFPPPDQARQVLRQRSHVAERCDPAHPDQTTLDFPWPDQATSDIHRPDQAPQEEPHQATLIRPCSKQVAGNVPGEATLHPRTGLDQVVGELPDQATASGGEPDKALGPEGGAAYAGGLPDQATGRRRTDGATRQCTLTAGLQQAGCGANGGPSTSREAAELLARIHVIVAIAGAYFKQDEMLASAAQFLDELTI
eukprot:jgi/Botrbrau1/19969/Bobra.0059s0084.2